MKIHLCSERSLKTKKVRTLYYLNKNLKGILTKECIMPLQSIQSQGHFFTSSGIFIIFFFSKILPRRNIPIQYIHLENLYSATSRKLRRGSSSPTTVKKISFNTVQLAFITRLNKTQSYSKDELQCSN